MNFSRLWFLPVMALSAVAGATGTVHAEEDEYLIIIEDDEDEAVEATPDEPASEPGITRLIEDNVLFQTRLRQDFFDAGGNVPSVGSLSSLELTSGVLTDALELHLNGLWRWWVPDVNEVGEDRLGDWAAWYEFYVKQSWGRFLHLQMGKQMVPWGHTQVFALGDRLQPAYRTHGAAFLEPVKGSEPLWGVSLRTQASILSSETVLMFPWNAERNYLTSDDQGHFQFGRYQEALGRRHEGTQPAERMGSYMEQQSALEQLAVGTKVHGQIDEITLGLSGVWGPDQTPVLLGEDAAYRPFMTSLGLDWRPNSCPTWGCGQLPEEALFSRRKVSSLTVDATWGFGLAIVKMEWLHYLAEIPNMGKTLWLLNDLGLRSASAAYDAASVALESGLGEWVEGSLELALFRWGNLPAGERLFGIEPMSEDVSNRTEFYRAALGARLNGYLWPQWVSWSFANETGLRFGDHQSKLELAFHWPDKSLFMGVFTEWFDGPVNSPGALRRDRSRSGVMMGGGPW